MAWAPCATRPFLCPRVDNSIYVPRFISDNQLFSFWCHCLSQVRPIKLTYSLDLHQSEWHRRSEVRREQGSLYRFTKSDPPCGDLELYLVEVVVNLSIDIGVTGIFTYPSHQLWKFPHSSCFLRIFRLITCRSTRYRGWFINMMLNEHMRICLPLLARTGACASMSKLLPEPTRPCKRRSSVICTGVGNQSLLSIELTVNSLALFWKQVLWFILRKSFAAYSGIT